MAQGECSVIAIIYLLTHIIRTLNTDLGDTGGEIERFNLLQGGGDFVNLQFGERAEGLQWQGYASV